MKNKINNTAGVSVKVRSFSYAQHKLVVSDLPFLLIHNPFLNDNQKKRCNKAKK